MLILGENIYITIDNISMSGKKSCLKNIPDTLQLIFILSTNIISLFFSFIFFISFIFPLFSFSPILFPYLFSYPPNLFFLFFLFLFFYLIKVIFYINIFILTYKLNISINTKYFRNKKNINQNQYHLAQDLSLIKN